MIRWHESVVSLHASGLPSLSTDLKILLERRHDIVRKPRAKLRQSGVILVSLQWIHRGRGEEGPVSYANPVGLARIEPEVRDERARLVGVGRWQDERDEQLGVELDEAKGEGELGSAVAPSLKGHNDIVLHPG